MRLFLNQQISFLSEDECFTKRKNDSIVFKDDWKGIIHFSLRELIFLGNNLLLKGFLFTIRRSYYSFYLLFIIDRRMKRNPRRRLLVCGTFGRSLFSFTLGGQIEGSTDIEHIPAINIHWSRS